LSRAREKLRTVHTGHTIATPPPRAPRGPGSPFVVGTLGALSPRKNPRAFLDLARRVLAAVPEARFRIGGDIVSPELARFRDELRGFAGSTLGGAVEWSGWVDDPLAFLARLDVFVQTSRSEGLPGAVREAMAMAVPVVATDVGGTREAVLHGKTGYLTGVDDWEGLAAATIRLARDPMLAVSLGHAGRRRFESLFAAEPFVRGTLSVLFELVPNLGERASDHGSRVSHSEIAAT
jgi:glycosyltransferase involved in cell wall biosynthesis